MEKRIKKGCVRNLRTPVMLHIPASVHTSGTYCSMRQKVINTQQNTDVIKPHFKYYQRVYIRKKYKKCAWARRQANSSVNPCLKPYINIRIGFFSVLFLLV